MGLRTVIAGLCIVSASSVFAEPLDEKSARKQLFRPNGVVLEMVDDHGLDTAGEALLDSILAGLKAQKIAVYYGAVVASSTFFDDPAVGGAKGLFQVSERLHNPEAAENIAMDACNAAAKKARAEACVLLARILPKRWEERDVMLSVSATKAFKAYRNADAPKAFAISVSSKSYGMATGTDIEAAETEAVATCAQKYAEEPASDCLVVIRDE